MAVARVGRWSRQGRDKYLELHLPHLFQPDLIDQITIPFSHDYLDGSCGNGLSEVLI